MLLDDGQKGHYDVTVKDGYWEPVPNTSWSYAFELHLSMLVWFSTLQNNDAKAVDLFVIPPIQPFVYTMKTLDNNTLRWR